MKGAGNYIDFMPFFRSRYFHRMSPTPLHTIKKELLPCTNTTEIKDGSNGSHNDCTNCEENSVFDDFFGKLISSGGSLIWLAWLEASYFCRANTTMSKLSLKKIERYRGDSRLERSSLSYILCIKKTESTVDRSENSKQ